MDHAALPPYTPSPPSPRYSNELLPGEQTVQSTRSLSPRSPTGVCRRITDFLTIVLRDQPPGSVYPSYGRNGVIQGDVTLGNTTDLSSVLLKVEGSFLLHASRLSVSTTFLSITKVLWSASDTQHCPRTIPFKVAFPLTFDDGGQMRTLPPTFEGTGTRVACSYTLTIELLRPRQFLSFLKGNETVKVPLVYRPRSRPHLPTLTSDSRFMSTVKSSPEEWHEVICTLPMSQASGLAHVECLLFIPSVLTFALSDTIPFHLQIRGNPASLIPLLGQHDRQGVTEQQNEGVVIRVYLLRQINVRIHGQSATECHKLGEGKLESSQQLPPKHHTFLRYPLREGLDSLDWDGVLGFDADVTVPSFFASQFSIKDSIVLSVAPRQPLKSPVLGVKHYFPVQLVTDPWSNDT